MERLSQSDLDRVLRFVGEIAGVDHVADFPVRVLDGLKRLIPCDLIGYNEIDPVGGQALMVLDPHALDHSGLEGQRAFQRLVHEHPVLRYHARTRDGRALTISDFLSRDEFHRLDLYAESFRLIGAEDQLAVALPASPPMVIGLAFNRSRRTFSQRDKQLLDLVRPHLAQARRNAQMRSQLTEMVVLLETLVDATDRAIVLLDRRLTVRRASSRAVALFAAHFGFHLAEGNAVPAPVEAWIRCSSGPDGLNKNQPGQPFIVDGDRGRLVIRFLPRGESNEYDALLLQQIRVQTERGPLNRLSRRETEVLGWVSRGKTNPQIATLLSISTGTVQKHLEHIYDKLGVRTRAAAAVALAGSAVTWSGLAADFGDKAQ